MIGGRTPTSFTREGEGTLGRMSIRAGGRAWACFVLVLSSVVEVVVADGVANASPFVNCTAFTTCSECRSNNHPGCTWCPSRQSCLDVYTVAMCHDPAQMCPIEDDKDTGKETRCSTAIDCTSCLR